MEEYKKIDGYDNYLVSNLGNVKSIMFGKERLLKFTCNAKTNGYRFVNLYQNKKVKNIKVHRLVAKAFIINPENKPCVNHKDGNKLNNNANNLEWNTYSENTIHTFKVLGHQANKNMLGRTGKLNPCSIKINQYTLDNIFIKTWDSTADVERELNISRSNINCVLKNRTKTAGGFIWKYTEK